MSTRPLKLGRNNGKYIDTAIAFTLKAQRQIFNIHKVESNVNICHDLVDLLQTIHEIESQIKSINCEDDR